jgi:hypothetical protein
MADVAVVLKQLQEERSRIEQAIAALAQLNGSLDGSTSGSNGSRRPLSTAARSRIAAAQRARWAKLKKAA